MEVDEMLKDLELLANHRVPAPVSGDLVEHYCEKMSGVERKPQSLGACEQWKQAQEDHLAHAKKSPAPERKGAKLKMAIPPSRSDEGVGKRGLLDLSPQTKRLKIQS